MNPDKKGKTSSEEDFFDWMVKRGYNEKTFKIGKTAKKYIKDHTELIDKFKKRIIDAEPGLRQWKV